MYQGENAKFIIKLEDSNGNIIPKLDVSQIRILIYGEADRRTYLRYFYPAVPDESPIEEVPDEEQFFFHIDGAESLPLPPGRYMISIKSITDSADFLEGLVDIEEAPIFTIVKTVIDG